jgi:hypothetical protein
MSEQNEQMEEKKYPVSVSAKFAGGTLLASLPFDLLAHLGPTGLLVGGLASYVAWKHGPEVYESLRDIVPGLPSLTQALDATNADGVSQKSGRSFIDRAMGRFPEGYLERINEQSHETVPSAPIGQSNDMIDLAPQLHIHKNDIIGKAIFVCGIRRHGKTTLGARLAEQLGKFYIPMFIPDLEGDYISLADVLPKAIIAGHPSVDQQYLDYDFVALGTTQAAYQLGYDLLENGCQVILDMVSYPVLDQAVAIQVNIIRGMFRWANEHTSGRVPAYVYLDEAQRFLPQTLNDSVIKNKDLIQALLDAYMDIIAIGGKRGINPLVLTQRFAQVNNKIMAQSEVFFLMRQTHDTDLKRCMEYANPPITKDQISKLKPGEGIYIATDGTQIVTQFQQRASSGKRSSTPQAEAAQRYADRPVRLGNGSFTPEEMELPVYKKKPTAVPAAPTTSFSPSENGARLHLVESERNTITSGTKDSEGALPLRQLSELEMRVEDLFLEKKMNPAAIVRELWPDIKGGDAYQKKSIEVADAIRAIFEVRRGA